jgi:4-diphosphocytidyl-2-C-methyl-D-erythritol kinase
VPCCTTEQGPGARGQGPATRPCIIVKSLAKVNLDLRVLHKRADGFHELRTVFQTISLADTLQIDYEPARRTRLEIDSDIPDNLVIRAARAVLGAMRTAAHVRFQLTKRIPMGGGLGGGSSNAAAVLLAFPVLARRPLPLEKLIEIGAGLGSDVPFFLTGGTQMALGTGTETYLLPDIAEEHLLIAASGIHVATGPAYQALQRGLTLPETSSSISSFQAYVRALGERRSAGQASALSGNDFEEVVFRKYPKLKKIARKLRAAGAGGVRMTGSGSAVFGIFGSKAESERVRKVLEGDGLFEGCRLLPAKLIGRRGYERLWRRQLHEHLDPNDQSWPPRTRYAR